jgi:hypothetical protein
MFILRSSSDIHSNCTSIVSWSPLLAKGGPCVRAIPVRSFRIFHLSWHEAHAFSLPHHACVAELIERLKKPSAIGGGRASLTVTRTAPALAIQKCKHLAQLVPAAARLHSSTSGTKRQYGNYRGAYATTSCGRASTKILIRIEAFWRRSIIN